MNWKETLLLNWVMPMQRLEFYGFIVRFISVTVKNAFVLDVIVLIEVIKRIILLVKELAALVP
jgi:hypothetical protein